MRNKVRLSKIIQFLISILESDIYVLYNYDFIYGAVTARGRRSERSYEAGVDTGTSQALYSMKEISLNDFKSLNNFNSIYHDNNDVSLTNYLEI